MDGFAEDGIIRGFEILGDGLFGDGGRETLRDGLVGGFGGMQGDAEELGLPVSPAEEERVAEVGGETEVTGEGLEVGGELDGQGGGWRQVVEAAAGESEGGTGGGADAAGRRPSR